MLGLWRSRFEGQDPRADRCGELTELTELPSRHARTDKVGNIRRLRERTWAGCAGGSGPANQNPSTSLARTISYRAQVQRLSLLMPPSRQILHLLLHHLRLRSKPSAVFLPLLFLASPLILGFFSFIGSALVRFLIELRTLGLRTCAEFQWTAHEPRKTQRIRRVWTLSALDW